MSSGIPRLPNIAKLLWYVGIVPLLAFSGISGPEAIAGQFATGVSLVEVYATVTGQDGRPIRGLTAADFRVTENGEPQDIAVFTTGEFPLSVALAVDRSFSMGRERLSGAAVAARSFIASLRPADQVMVLAVGSETETVAPLGADHTAASAAVGALDVWGTTPLYDAVREAIDAVQPAAGRRALILISDGHDSDSRSTATETITEARRRDVLVYPIAYGRSRPEVFAELAVVTGGRSFLVNSAQELQRALTTNGEELRFQYMFGYTPSRPAPHRPEWRGIDVSVSRPGVRVRARDGYVASRR
jgi:Ca-activated chloride channel family protein